MKKGISLIVLVITIIVIIILAGAVILSLADNNPIASANKATCLSDVANFKSAVALDFAYQVSQTTTGSITYAAGASVTALESTLSTKYGLTATISNAGAISFTGGTSLPEGVTLEDLN
jgi:flagellar basal body-associated protein FliL